MEITIESFEFDDFLLSKDFKVIEVSVDRSIAKNSLLVISLVYDKLS